MGGLANHINHVYENKDLRFRDIKEIFRNISRGEIEIYEKFDGQNLFVTWDFYDEKVKVARNKKNIKDGGLDRYGLSLKFGDRPEIEKLFTEAYDELAKMFDVIDHNDKSQMFGNLGGIWFSIEIINPELPNTIIYDKKRIVFHKHGPVYFGYDAEIIETNLDRNLELLEDAIPEMNEVSSWDICGPQELEIETITESEIQDFCKELDKIYINDQASLRIYAFKRIRADMERFPLIPMDVRLELAKMITEHPRSKTVKQITSSLDKFVKDQALQMVDLEKENYKNLMDPIENIVYRFSCKLLSKTQSDFITDIKSENDRIKMEYDKCCNIMQDSEKAEWLESMMSKVNSDDIGIEGIVFQYKGSLYKMTGNFAPMNRIIAGVKYSNKKSEKNKTNDSLAAFISVG